MVFQSLLLKVLLFIILQANIADSALVIPLNVTNLHLNTTSTKPSTRLYLPPLPYNFPINGIPDCYLRFVKYGGRVPDADFKGVSAQADEELAQEEPYSRAGLVENNRIWHEGKAMLGLKPKYLEYHAVHLLFQGLERWQDLHGSVEFLGVFIQYVPGGVLHLSTVSVIDSSIA
ncbi:hypothetical protein ACLMJK_001606 [Lecanora helva]